MTWTEWAPRRAVWGLQTGLAAWRPAGRALGGRVSDPAGDGLRDAGRLVTDRRIVGRTGTGVDLRPTWIVAPHVCRSRVDHCADGRRVSGPSPRVTPVATPRSRRFSGCSSAPSVSWQA